LNRRGQDIADSSTDAYAGNGLTEGCGNGVFIAELLARGAQSTVIIWNWHRGGIDMSTRSASGTAGGGCGVMGTTIRFMKPGLD
jgi:hypothetical protein